ncbi:gamma-glutamyltranspeptidase [Atractiella rhizophila]|nr:gamma-glutamyltranspeptidase [Atractiella rhizophila]
MAPPSSIPPNIAFNSRRSVVFSTKGMVSASQPFAVQCGLEVLKKGGNAADAAVATAAAINLTEPCSCGIGGDVFCLFWDAKSKTMKALNGSGRSPAALTLSKARELGIKGHSIHLTNINSVTVPGSAAAWVDTVEMFGSGKLTLKEILLPAIELAEGGVPISELTSDSWKRSAKRLLEASPNGPEMLVNDESIPLRYRGPNAGELWRNENLAQTFREVAEKGKSGFYKGRVAESLVDVVQSQGGVMTLEDLASHTSTPTKPISYKYLSTPVSSGSPVTLHEHAPNGQGLTALIALGILDQLCLMKKVPWNKDSLQTTHNSVEWLHALIESMRFAFADTRYYVADPEKYPVPVKELLSTEYLKSRAELFDPTKAKADVTTGSPVISSDTVYFTTSDADGNACSFIMSNYAGFGNGAIPRGCGFTLQNRGSNFVLEEGHPNCLDGGKRPYHTIIPAMATRDDDLFMAYGVMGGFMRVDFRFLLNMLHFGMNPQAALDAPRFCISAGMPEDDSGSMGSIVNSEVFLEEGIDPKVASMLKDMGHDVELVSGYGRGQFGRGQIIQKLVDAKTGKLVWAAGSDPRADGAAVAQF